AVGPAPRPSETNAPEMPASGFPHGTLGSGHCCNRRRMAETALSQSDTPSADLEKHWYSRATPSSPELRGCNRKVKVLRVLDRERHDADQVTTIIEQPTSRRACRHRSADLYVSRLVFRGSQAGQKTRTKRVDEAFWGSNRVDGFADRQAGILAQTRNRSQVAICSQVAAIRRAVAAYDVCIQCRAAIDQRDGPARRH